MTTTPNLTGAAKAAIVVLFLDEELATQVLSCLDEHELRLLAQAVDDIEPTAHAALPGVLAEFEEQLRGPVMMGASTEYMRRLATAAVGEEQANLMFTEAAQAAGNPLAGLRSARPSTLAELLSEEHPQVAAVVLTQVSAVQASAVLAYFDEDAQADLVRRVAKIEEVPENVLHAASESILRALSAAGPVSVPDSATEFNGVDFAASLLNALPPADCERLLETLDDDELGIGDRVREAMFTFEDLGRLDNRALQGLMREVSMDDLAVALRSAGESLREVFFGAISSRAAETLREDLEFMPPKRLSEVEAAQRNIVEAAMQLSAEGKLELPGSSNEELV